VTHREEKKTEYLEKRQTNARRSKIDIVVEIVWSFLLLAKTIDSVLLMNLMKESTLDRCRNWTEPKDVLNDVEELMLVLMPVVKSFAWVMFDHASYILLDLNDAKLLLLVMVTYVRLMRH